MKTKNFYLCLLLLVLGTANVWADKYYQAKYYRDGNTRYTTLDEMISSGAKFMIYNSAIQGSGTNYQDYTGFIYNDGANVVLDKSKERDRYVYNEKYVFTMEGIDTDADGNYDQYAIKSVLNGTYVDIYGNMNATAQPLYIKDWYTVNDTQWNLAGVNVESFQYEFVTYANSRSTGQNPANCNVFLVSNNSDDSKETADRYWSGSQTDFFDLESGQPFAFVIINEITDASYIQDLHIFSRCDLYSAQVIWGCVQTAGDITVSPDGTDDAAANTLLLIDGDATTTVNTAAGTGKHYFQFDLGEAVSSIYLYMERGGDYTPTSINIQASTTGADDSWVDISTGVATSLATKHSFTTNVPLNGDYQYIRVVNATADAQMSLAEIYILPDDPNKADDKVDQSINYFNELQTGSSTVYGKDTPQGYELLINNYNTLYAETKTLSGVPLPGNKYRIYADAYDGTRFVNKEIVLENGAVGIKSQGAYADAATDARKAYEWYCEKTADGYLVFKNVNDPTKYLANNGTVTDTPYKWTISTVETNRFGVPLKDGSGNYLAITNAGVWQGDVTAAQDQTKEYTYKYTETTVNDNGTAGDESDDYEEEIEKTTTVAAGVCTDFVFIPVDITAEEKKVTFTANDLVCRNTTFTFDDVEYSLPFSYMFTSNDELKKVKLTLKCPTLHRYKETYVNGSDEADDSGKAEFDGAAGVVTFNYAAMANGDVLDIKFTIEEPFKKSTGSMLYLIRNLRPQTSEMQAPGMRKADTDIDIDGGGPIPTVGANMYYAKFTQKDTPIELIEGTSTVDYSIFDAYSLFYFEEVDASTDEAYSVNIHSAISPMECISPTLWGTAGETWNVQPNVASGKPGYTIGLEKLYANANWAQYNAWLSNHDDGHKVVSGTVNDTGALWEFLYVEPADASDLLKKYIIGEDGTTGIAGTVKTTIAKLLDEGKTNNEKAEKYTALIDQLITETTTAFNAQNVETLVTLSQEVHMLEHEIAYALLPLPEVTDRDKIGVDGKFDHPHWYYIYNTKSKTHPQEQNEYYAKFNGVDNLMALDQITDANGDSEINVEDLGLEHMFYFEGTKFAPGIDEEYDTKENALTFDDYLQVDIHNFAAPGKTVRSSNEEVYSATNVDPASIVVSGKQTIATLSGNKTLGSDESWRITVEYELSDRSFNAFGSCLLAGKDPTTDSYDKNFQVYLKDAKYIVVKGNGTGAYDRYKLEHTQDKYSKLKVVVSYDGSQLSVDVYNEDGDRGDGPIVLSGKVSDITQIMCALPTDGETKIASVYCERLKEMNWIDQDLDGEVAGQDDTWYILPSSNTNYPGYSIVAQDAIDSNFGWTNVTASNQEIFSDAGNADNSSWQFVQIKEFDAHVDQLLEKYNASDCVIYNEKLAALFRLLSKNASYIKKVTYNNPIEIDGVEKTDEDFFNEIYEAIKNYDGPMPDELKKPKPGKFYTIRPAYGNSDVRVAVNDLNCLVQREGLIEVVDDKKHYDSHSVWFFDGTADGEYLKRDENLTLNSLHTQSNTKDFEAERCMLDDDAEAENIELLPVGGCIVRLNDGSFNLRHKAIGDTALVGNEEDLSYGYVNTTFNRTGTDDASVTSTAFNEFSELVLSDDEVNTPFSVSVESNKSFKGTVDKITSAILCPDINGDALSTDADATDDKKIILTLTYTNLPSSFTSFNSIGLDIHALNGSSAYQYNNDSKSRKFNVAVQVGKTEDALQDFGSLNEIDIAAGIGQSQVSVHKVWTLTNDAPATITGNTLVVRLTVTSNSTLCRGCFFGLSNVILSAEGDTWYIEEMPDADKENIFHETKTNSNIGLGSLMLGYTAKIPTGISAFYPATNQDLTDRHITFRSYGEPSDPVRLLPACTPAILKIADGADKSATYRFYYDANEVDDAADKATEDEKIIIEGSLYKKYVHVANTYGNRFGDGYSSNVYMYLSSSTTPKLTWVWYNYTAEGVNTGNNNTGGHVNVNANRAYIVMGKAVAKNIGSFSMRFDGGWTTDIEDIEDDYSQEEANEGAEGIFDLQGRKLDEITAPGIYIVNGEKVLVK